VEWARLIGYGRIGTASFAAMAQLGYLWMVFAPVMGWSTQTDGTGSASKVLYGAAAAFWLIAVPAWLHARWKARPPLVAGVAGWVVLVPTWVALVELQSNPSQLLFVMAVVWVADTAAYLVGRSVGRRRLAPHISPGKTWEGVAGAVAGVAVYYALAHAAGIPQDHFWRDAGGLMTVALVMVMSIEGDLFESWMKRQASVKDSGSLLPGHGGLLDRVDGLTASLPVAALILSGCPLGAHG
jgi:phosphatidate cytidylyltransferase